MPLQVLLPIVVLGIAAIAVMTWVMGYHRPLAIAGEADARARWLREWPEDTVRAVRISADGSAALVSTDRGPGLLVVMGADTAARRLGRHRLLRREDGLVIDPRDVAAGRVRLRLAPGERDAWAADLEEEAKA